MNTNTFNPKLLSARETLVNLNRNLHSMKQHGVRADYMPLVMAYIEQAIDDIDTVLGLEENSEAQPCND